MRILKFGGSSVGSVESLHKVKAIVTEKIGTGERLVVVVSALQSVTDQLLSLGTRVKSPTSIAAELQKLVDRHQQVAQAVAGDEWGALSKRLEVLYESLKQSLTAAQARGAALAKDLDEIASFGERLSAEIVAAMFRSVSPECLAMDSRELILTDDRFGNAVVFLEESYSRIQNRFSQAPQLVIATGFIGATRDGFTTTLGRGGSDLSASLFGAALSAEEIEIWTDVDGVLTADPRKVSRAFPLPHLSYFEAMELSHFGAKVIYPPTIQPAMDKGIPVLIKNTFNPQAPGTIIDAVPAGKNHIVTGISSLNDIALFRLEGSGMVGVAGVASRLFGALAREGISVILISQASSEHSICFAILPQQSDRALEALMEEFSAEIAARRIDPPTVERELSIVAVVGENMRHTPGVAGRMFETLGRNGINIIAIAQGSSELNISAVIKQSDERKALNVLHDAFFLGDRTTVNLFLLGTGLVGSGLLEQLDRHRREVEESHRTVMRLVGIANSRGVLIRPDGIEFGEALGDLQREGKEVSREDLARVIRELNLANTIFIECSANDEVTDLYEELLQASISVVTPNKRGLSGPQDRYDRLQAAARLAHVKFFYEATVGAGLPVIGTLRDLLASGDKVLQIEAVLSGTLSFLMNQYDGSRSFAALVRDAKERGFTEPDPRDDLSGADVGRKLLILAREMGLKLSFDQVRIESLVSSEGQRCKTVEEYLDHLEREEERFSKRLRDAQASGKRLRYIARIERGSAGVALEAVDQSSPFYFLAGSDNMISFSTERYRERPLVVRGPGAGREVTAAGVFADILRVASYLA